MADTDTLSPEQLSTLRDVHNQLVLAGDPRADRVKAYIDSQTMPRLKEIREGKLDPSKADPAITEGTAAFQKPVSIMPGTSDKGANIETGTGADIATFPLRFYTNAMEQTGRGGSTMSQPKDLSDLAHGTNEFLLGSAKLATPFAAGSVPVSTLIRSVPNLLYRGALGGGVGFGVEKTGEALGIPQGLNELGNTLTGGLAAMFAGTPTIPRFVKGGFQPIQDVWSIIKNNPELAGRVAVENAPVVGPWYRRFTGKVPSSLGGTPGGPTPPTPKPTPPTETEPGMLERLFKNPYFRAIWEQQNKPLPPGRPAPLKTADRGPRWQEEPNVTQVTPRKVTNFVSEQPPMGMDAEGNVRPGAMPSGRTPGPAPQQPIIIREPRVSLPEQYGAEPSPRGALEFAPAEGVQLESGRIPGQPQPVIDIRPPRVSVPEQAGAQASPRTVTEFKAAEGVSLPSGRKPGTGIPKPPSGGGFPKPPTQEQIDAEIAKGNAAEAAHKAAAAEKAAAEKAATEKAAAEAADKKPGVHVELKEGMTKEHAEYAARKAQEIAEASLKKDNTVGARMRQQKITLRDFDEMNDAQLKQYIEESGFRVRGPIRRADLRQNLANRWK